MSIVGKQSLAQPSRLGKLEEMFGPAVLQKWFRNSLRGLPLSLAGFLFLPTPVVSGATLNASLDRDAITLGEGATLSLTFSGGNPDAVPTPPNVPDLQIVYAGSSSQMSFLNGAASSSVTYSYQVAPRKAGDFVIPSFTVRAGGQVLSTPVLNLKVGSPTAPPPQALAAQWAFIKVALPKTNAYVGETVVAEVHLYLRNGVRGIRDFQTTSFPADGLLAGKLIELEGQRRQARIGNAVYTIIPLAIPLRVMSPGRTTIGPVTASVMLQLPSANRQRDILKSSASIPSAGSVGRRNSLHSPLNRKRWFACRYRLRTFRPVSTVQWVPMPCK